MKNTTIPIRYNIDGILYQAVTEKPTIGDLVLDTGDNTYGYIDMIKDDKAAVKQGWVAEVGVPISRLIKLVPSIENNSTN